MCKDLYLFWGFLRKLSQVDVGGFVRFWVFGNYGW